MVKSGLFIGFALLITSAIFIGACTQQPASTYTPVTFSLPELKYHLISSFDDLFYVDPDYWPVPREGQEEKNALEQFPSIRANEAEFSAILEYLSLSYKDVYTSEEKLLIYRQQKKLTLGVQMTTSGDVFQFTLRVREGEGERIEGTITTSGKITVLKREPSFNTYPICLASGTLIDTPDGPVSVEQLYKGMTVWTVDDSGKRSAVVVVETTTTSVPSFFQVVRLRLDDGRSVTASPGHPTAELRALGDYQVGDTLDGALVITVEHVAYNNGVTYDILPSGSTGLYWANGILLKSTLTTN